jgi:tetrahydromethanopterin S-methyltransferase subunit G
MRTGVRELTHRQGWLYGAVIGIFIGLIVGHFFGDALFGHLW